MSALEWLDDLYEGFVGGLPAELRPHARRIAHTLGLVPVEGVPWREVFGHEVTLAAPGMFAEAMPGAAEDAVARAVLAHLLSIIEAFGQDRVADGQVEGGPELKEILVRMVAERDRALTQLDPSSALEIARADRALTAAFRRERETFGAQRAVTLQGYEATAVGKQQPGLLAAVALARHEGWDERRVALVRATLLDLALGLQCYDDAVDWEDDFARGAAWAVALARGSTRGVSAPKSLASARRVVFDTGALHTLLARASARMDAAATRARLLGASRLAQWADAQAQKVAGYARDEARSAGHLVRARALSGWAEQVLDGRP